MILNSDGIFCRRVLALVLASVALCACGSGASRGQVKETPPAKQVKKRSGDGPPRDAPRAPFGPPARVATIQDPAVDESSGLAASRRQPGLFWTHNDAGDGPFIYAVGGAGAKRGTWRVAGARHDDWEDIAAGPGPQPGRTYLYVGDIGDNPIKRANITVYRVAEPTPAPEDASSTTFEPRQTEPAEAIVLRYPDGPHDAEALAVHPRTGDIYVITKEAEGPAGVYKAAAQTASAQASPSGATMERVGQVSAPGVFPGMFTGADISPDGRRVVLCDYIAAYELSLGADARAPFDDVWKQTPLAFDLGKRKQGEAVCYGANGESVFATSEDTPGQLIEVRRQARAGGP
ncbi:MAG TPA: hypothetical protein VER08_09320 [Pyrinomonadaceae bacterium]|nr:hypothetical protein [Pyrinomonadaceae bacterium]